MSVSKTEFCRFESDLDYFEKCNISDWNGKELIFELHHIDGNKNNNVKNNLQILCPNCHSQTDTFRNKKRI